ncbi:MAG TPA: dinitrogenase iron-molybdenum cofactor biosynthesis protein [Chloroflexi bacterium]|nr:dinitrogenase iron-molybdenum cofactor biosynthesis protein [Chloroflexota bacterium]
MRVAVSADDSNGLDSVVSPHFGRCPYYVLVDLEGREVRQVSTVANPYYDHHQPGKVPAFIHGQGTDVMLTGGMGRRALALFEQYGVEAVTGASGTVRHTLERYLGGELRGAEPCRKSGGHVHEGEPAADGYEQGDVGRLREEAEMLQRQLAEVMERLDGLTAR